MEENLETKRPRVQTLESLGTLKVIRTFSQTKDKQVLGGKVLEGSIIVGSQVKIMRRDVEIGAGKVKELQQQKSKVNEIKEGNEFGVMIEAKVEIATGDQIESFVITER